jgi:glycosyltransferase involved in cell wall biosynthesis
MNVSIVSPFRNSEEIIPGYIERVTALERHELRFICVEGDSTDETLAALTQWAAEDGRVSVVKCETGKPHYGSIVHPERFEILARVFNTGLAACDYGWSDRVIFIPSDVHFEPDLLTRLIACDKDLIAAMFWRKDGNGLRFYDIWGFVGANGVNFRPYPPAWYSTNLPDEPIEMENVGGVIMYKTAVLEAGCRYTNDRVDHGMCSMARDAGFGVWCDPTTHVIHL